MSNVITIVHMVLSSVTSVVVGVLSFLKLREKVASDPALEAMVKTLEARIAALEAQAVAKMARKVKTPKI